MGRSLGRHDLTLIINNKEKTTMYTLNPPSVEDRQQKHFTPEEKERAVAMAAAGFPTSEIGKALGRTRHSVTGLFSVMGIRPTKLRQAVVDQPEFPGPVLSQ